MERMQAKVKGDNIIYCPHCGRNMIVSEELTSEKYLLHPYCGRLFRNPLLMKEVKNIIVCPNCGELAQKAPNYTSRKDWPTTLFLCWFLGIFGIHSFYVGKVKNGIFQLLTLGGFGIWTLIDFFNIVLRNYRDGEGKLIVYVYKL